MECLELRLFPHRGTTSGAVCGVAAPKVTVSSTHQAERIPLDTENLQNPCDCKDFYTPNVEPEDRPFEKENSLPKLHFWLPC